MFEYEGWSVTAEDLDPSSFLVLVAFVKERDTIKARFDIDKRMFLDHVPFQTTPEQRELITNHVASLRLGTHPVESSSTITFAGDDSKIVMDALKIIRDMIKSSAQDPDRIVIDVGKTFYSAEDFIVFRKLTINGINVKVRQ